MNTNPFATPGIAIAGILIGGRGARMGTPKALIMLNGATLLERTVEIARAACDDVVMLGDPPFVLPNSLRPLPILSDSPPAVGPVAGLQSLLIRIEANPPAVGILLGCDMPFVAAELIRRLRATHGDHDAVVPRSDDGQLHPCCALYRSSALPVVGRQIAARQFAMMDLLSALRVHPLELSAAQSRWVQNWNTPDDVQELGGQCP